MVHYSMYRQIMGGIAALMLISTTVHAAILGIPTPHTTVSGIGVVSGWKCEAGELTVRFNGGPPVPLVYGSQRPDVLKERACDHDRVGFLAIMNWGELGDGQLTAVVYDDGVEFDRSTFDVVTTGESFLLGATGQCIAPDFPAPNENARFIWNQATQHMELAEVGDAELLSHEGEGGIICEGSNEERTITCEYRESVPPAVDSFLDDDGCFQYWAQPQHPGTNWYLVREWAIVYGFLTTGKWHRGDRLADGYIAPSVYVRPVADDIPGTWNQQRYREIPFDDQAFYHLQQNPSRGQGVPNSYTQFQFYALGPLSAYEEGKPCFREIP